MIAVLPRPHSVTQRSVKVELPFVSNESGLLLSTSVTEVRMTNARHMALSSRLADTPNSMDD